MSQKTLLSLLIALLVLTYLSRFTSASILGVSVVYSTSMLPALSPGDLVLYANVGYGAGDIVVYCTTPSFCVVHRVVQVGNSTIVAKGDNNPAPDPPVSIDKVKGKVVLALPHYIWVPLAGAFLAPSIVHYVRSRQHYVIVLLATVVLFLALVFLSNNQAYLPLPKIYYPHVYLSKSDVCGCSIVVEYTSDIPMEITSWRLVVDGVDVSERAVADGTRVLVDAPDLVSLAYQERGFLIVQANVTFNTTTTLSGVYKIIITGAPLRFWANGSSVVVIENRNCFPVNVTVATPLSEKLVIVPGNSVVAVEVEQRVTAEVKYRVWGEEVRVQVPVGR